MFSLAVVPVLGEQTHVFSSEYQNRELMIIYGLGFAAIYFCLSALYWNAWRQRAALELNSLEVSITLSHLWNFFGIGCVGLICCLIARLMPPATAGRAGWFFFLAAPWGFIHGRVSARKIKAARLRSSEGSQTGVREQIEA